MKFVPTLATTVLVVLATAAQADVTGQQFQFQNPVPSVNANNALFVTSGVTPSGFVPPFSTLQNILGDAGNPTGRIDLLVANVSSTGVSTDQAPSLAAKYYLTPLPAAPTTLVTSSAIYANNSTFLGLYNSGATTEALGSGLLTFVDPTSSTILLQISFANSVLSPLAYGAGTGAGVRFLGGSRFAPTVDQSLNNGNFSFAFSSDATYDYHSALFNSSVGTAKVVPEPSSMAALALGGLALLKRRRRA